MGICEPLASYDEVLKAELNNPIFTNEKQIVDTIKQLITRGILQKKIGKLSNREIKYLRDFDEIRFNDKSALCFTGREINQEIVQLRLKLYEGIFYQVHHPLHGDKVPVFRLRLSLQIV